MKEEQRARAWWAGVQRAGQGCGTEYIQIQSGWRRCSPCCPSCRRGSRRPSQAPPATAPSPASPEASAGVAKGTPRGEARGSEECPKLGLKREESKPRVSLAEAPARICPGPEHHGSRDTKQAEGWRGREQPLPKAKPQPAWKDTQLAHRHAEGWPEVVGEQASQKGGSIASLGHFFL